MRRLSHSPLSTALRMLVLTAMLMAPVGLFAWSRVNEIATQGHGAGLVLLVTLQRQALT
ncbi:hypothetical protein ACLE20_00105 [Rhizobium sp. YIM 134829]|uniref:hypothetical protein n=1 Tax=Rhizobium sp. YIM 134829 TaxID=3390453 RepID=UPI003978269D